MAMNILNQSPTLSVREENPNKTYKRIKPQVFTSVFQILNFRRTILTYFQDVLFYSN